MTDLEYLDRAEALLATIEARCDHLNETTDADIDSTRVGGMLTLGFANRSQIVINLQKPLQEVWMATAKAGHHYRFLDGAWRDTKSGSLLQSDLSAAATLQAGLGVRFDP